MMLVQAWRNDWPPVRAILLFLHAARKPCYGVVRLVSVAAIFCEPPLYRLLLGHAGGQTMCRF